MARPCGSRAIEGLHPAGFAAIHLSVDDLGRLKMSELHEHRLKRLSMRSWRRGTKEMDLVLGPWSDVHLSQLSAEKLNTYEALLDENDQDLMPWVLGQAPAPAHIQELILEISEFAGNRWTPKN